VQLLDVDPDPEVVDGLADVSKLLVRRSARGQGVATRLLATVEADAAGLGRTLLVLDTETGSDAESLYARRGWRRVGSIDDFALTPDGALSGTTIFSKRVAAP
jgi:GNAT superfamily N-acetyltransferase